MTAQQANLANYSGLENYVPKHGDVVVKANWFSTWIGVVSAVDRAEDALWIIFGGLPILLLTMDVAEQNRNMYKVRLSELKSAPKGKWAVMQHDTEHNANVWYV